MRAIGASAVLIIERRHSAQFVSKLNAAHFVRYTVDTLSSHVLVGVDTEPLAQTPRDRLTNAEQSRDLAPFLDDVEPVGAGVGDGSA
jgi:hypothetical protein